MLSKIDEYLVKHSKWENELSTLRVIFNNTELEECYKWGSPTYALKGKNIAGFSAFKNHFGIWFFQGVFLKDEHKLLVSAQEKTKALRQMRFTKDDIINEKIVLSYILEAIDNQKLGKVVKPSKNIEFQLADELKKIFNENNLLANAFKTLSKGKQKDYSNYIIEAKQEKTKAKRLEKITPMIMEGIGLHDKYKNC